jgi:hypothetical protein
VKRTHSLHALFATLVAGCGPVLSVDDDDGDDSSASDTVTMTGTATSQTTGMTTVVDTGWDDGLDDGCAQPVHIELFELPRSTLEEWLDAEGQIAPHHCWEACQAAGVWEDVLGCAVLDEGDEPVEPVPPEEPGTTSGSDTGDGGSDDTGEHGDTDTETGDDPLILLECQWTYFCGGGRGHEALRPAPARVEGDVVGRWAAATAHAEAASVAAFMALRDELAAHGAPEDLIARALEAARDEVRHARMMTRIALRRGAVPARPRFDRIEVRELEDLAIENAVEGCVRETWAALEATFAARAATDSDIRAVMGRIAIDETRHAELARDIDEWVRTRLDAAAVERIEAAREQAVTALLTSMERAQQHPALHERAGLPSTASARRLAEGLREAMWSAAC